MTFPNNPTVRLVGDKILHLFPFRFGNGVSSVFGIDKYGNLFGVFPDEPPVPLLINAIVEAPCGTLIPMETILACIQVKNSLN
ncbi:MAG: hypothetical protein D4R57_01170 [Verrucomicrobiales bacterium]|nr:MAG: hypothetical protein D4R57_01170 [Verrucomicrobiales bacterium]